MGAGAGSRKETVGAAQLSVNSKDEAEELREITYCLVRITISYEIIGHDGDVGAVGVVLLCLVPWSLEAQQELGSTACKLKNSL
jgi:hypothetical protein